MRWLWRVAGRRRSWVFGAARTEFTSTEAETQVTGKAAVGGPFSLVDQTGKRVTDKDFRGSYMLVFFGYTNCPDICPSGLQVMSAALDKLGPRGCDIVPILITLDPAARHAEKLASYVKSFSPRLIGLTGTESDIAATAKAYRVFFRRFLTNKTLRTTASITRRSST